MLDLRGQVDDTTAIALGLICCETNFLSDLSVLGQHISDTERSDLAHAHAGLMCEQEHAPVPSRMSSGTDEEQALLDLALAEYLCLGHVVLSPKPIN